MFVDDSGLNRSTVFDQYELKIGRCRMLNRIFSLLKEESFLPIYLFVCSNCFDEFSHCLCIAIFKYKIE